MGNSVMEVIALDWTIYSLTLAALLLFGVLYALLVNWMSRKQVTGQTAYLVVGGVTVALIASIPTLGLTFTSVLFSYFAACGFPMVIEYGMRVHQERTQDREKAQAQLKSALDEMHEDTQINSDNEEVHDDGQA